MKGNLRFLCVATIVVAITALVSCSGTNRDTSIKADLATKAESQKDFLGVTFRVENGVVILSGQCPTEKSRSSVESTAAGLYGVKSVTNNITIGPVVLGTDQSLKQSVDSVLKQYASVEAITKDSVVFLEGTIENDKMGKLTSAINSLKPRMIENKVMVK